MIEDENTPIFETSNPTQPNKRFSSHIPLSTTIVALICAMVLSSTVTYQIATKHSHSTLLQNMKSQKQALTWAQRFYSTQKSGVRLQWQDCDLDMSYCIFDEIYNLPGTTVYKLCAECCSKYKNFENVHTEWEATCEKFRKDWR